jgi:hypothetical protein
LAWQAAGCSFYIRLFASLFKIATYYGLTVRCNTYLEESACGQRTRFEDKILGRSYSCLRFRNWVGRHNVDEQKERLASHRLWNKLQTFELLQYLMGFWLPAGSAERAFAITCDMQNDPMKLVWSWRTCDGKEKADKDEEGERL